MKTLICEKCVTCHQSAGDMTIPGATPLTGCTTHVSHIIDNMTSLEYKVDSRVVRENSKGGRVAAAMLAGREKQKCENWARTKNIYYDLNPKVKSRAPPAPLLWPSLGHNTQSRGAGKANNGVECAGVRDWLGHLLP